MSHPIAMAADAVTLSEPGAPPGTLLLVDDEDGVVASLKRLFRRDGYRILTARGGEDGLALLESHDVDVIISDQRMPGMTGTEFLRRARRLRPHSVRIVLSGYTELQSITDAINEGAIFRFLAKPWDDEQLRGHIAEAFRGKALADENRRLTQRLQVANRELARANEQLGQLLAERQARIARNEQLSEVLHELLDVIPWPLVGMDGEGMVAAANASAVELFHVLVGSRADEVLPPELLNPCGGDAADTVSVGNRRFRCRRLPMEASSDAQGCLLLFAEDVA